MGVVADPRAVHAARRRAGCRRTRAGRSGKCRRDQRVSMGAFDREPSTIGRTVVLSGNRWDPALKRAWSSSGAKSPCSASCRRGRSPMAHPPVRRGAAGSPHRHLGSRRPHCRRTLRRDGRAAEARRQPRGRAPGARRHPQARRRDILRAINRTADRAAGAGSARIDPPIAVAAARRGRPRRRSERRQPAAGARWWSARTRWSPRAGRALRGCCGSSSRRACCSRSPAGRAAAVARWAVDLRYDRRSHDSTRARSRSRLARLRVSSFVCIVAAVVSGLAPAVMASRVDVQSIARDSNGRASASAGHARSATRSVIAEVASHFSRWRRRRHARAGPPRASIPACTRPG